MKRNFLFIISLFLIFSCSSEENNNSSDTNQQNEPIQRAFISSIENIGTNGSSILEFTYDSNNNLIENSTDVYKRVFTYSGNNIIKIESITLPNTAYYTVDFVYDSNSRIVTVKRDNHYNGTIFFTTYEYNSEEKVSKVCVYNSLEDFNNGDCNRFYEMSYIAGTTNYAQKSLEQSSINGSEFLEISEWNYDAKNRPYFGEAIKRIQLPYATDGTGIDYEFTYNSNNPTSKYIFDSSTNENKLRRDYTYQYNAEDMPTQVLIKTYSIFSGDVTNTFTQKYTYEMR